MNCYYNAKTLVECLNKVDYAICVFTEVQLKQSETSSKCPDPPNGASPWLFYKDYCYAFDMAFYNYSTYTADTARKLCKKLGMPKLCTSFSWLKSYFSVLF